MTRAKNAETVGVNGYAVRITLQGALLHVISRTEPLVHVGIGGHGGSLVGVDMEIVEGTEHGDTIGFIHWPSVTGITWRRL